MAYATVADVLKLLPDLSADGQQKAETLLDYAANILDALVNVDPTDEQQAALLSQVSVNMVVRAVSASMADAFGASNMSMTAGAYSQSWTYSNPSGDLYLTKLERQLLGISASYIGSVPAKVGHDD